MKLQQLRYLCSVVDHGFNITEASQTLFTSQPGISKQIRQLERELGVEMFDFIEMFSKNWAPSLVRNALRKQTHQPRPIHNQKFGVPEKEFLCGSIVRSLELRSQASNKPAHVNDR